ncbi:sigma 54-interacting transcriptional regulator [Halobacteriovorax sp. GB3]|uniref:sigma 54-interacting transcriptional regulator n=1 Tax=Halobacteriovorax sp. GB3 TaxID=2719615 RepID=UPI00235E96FB|nr:sigma 54-interacting transcriptional regulator [Halobacteriovorax sp. GB3]MDD0853211.1 sigma 54-interacting transcriptional regulator [Halobacteriovorax sp. GB3]
MLASFQEFKFYQSFRIPVEEADDLRFLIQKEDELGNDVYIEDGKLQDISVTGLGFSTKERISVGTPLTISLQFKKYHLDLTGQVVRAFSNTIEDEEIIYGVEIDEEKKIHKFLEQYILSFSSERLKECLIDSALKERYTKASEGFEMFSLLLSLFKDITHFGDKEGFLDNMLEEVVRIMNAQRSSIFLINPENNELEAIAALGCDKDQLKFDYRLGIAGSVFTTGVALNIDVQNDSSRFNECFDKMLEFQTKSIICHPIHNREDKIIGVIEVINKRNQDRFTIEDEKTMKVLALVFSSVFHGFNPISETSQLRRFSQPFDRKFALIGKHPHVGSLRNSIIKIKDLDEPVLIHGEKGVGKTLYAKILHHEGSRGLHSFDTIHCEDKDVAHLEKKLWGPGEQECVLTSNQGGTVLLHEVSQLSLEQQRKLHEIIKKRGIPESRINIDARIIATSSKDLGKLVDEGSFDREFYEFLSSAYIAIEPLRRRIDDLELLTEYFLKIECKKQGLLLKSFSPKAMQKMKDYDWPANVKELKTCIERAVLYNPRSHVITEVALENTTTPLLDFNHKQRMFGSIPFVSDFSISLKDRIALVEREMILAEIKRNNGNKSKAAKEMGISREALRKKLLMSNKVLDSLEGDSSPASLSEEKKAA